MIDLKEYSTFHSPGYVIEIISNNESKEFVFGNRETKPLCKECNSDTLYDIASLTKVYTSVLVYMAYEEGILNIYDSVFVVDDRFVNLEDVKVIDLLGHNQEIWTDGYLGDAKSKEEFYSILFSAYVKDSFPTYVDTHYIILSTILEKIYNKTFEELLKEKIFNVLNLRNTTVNPCGDNIASNNYETINNKIVENITPGLIHDTKARVAKGFGINTGHASIFTTGKDLLLFLKSFLDNTLLSKKTIELMLSHININLENYNILKNITLEDNVNKMYEKALRIDPNLKLMKTYNNMGVRFYNDIDELNDVPGVCSKNTVAFSGYTGPSFIIDFDKKIIVIVMCNVLHNTKLNRFERKLNTEVIINEICKQLY